MERITSSAQFRVSTLEISLMIKCLPLKIVISAIEFNAKEKLLS